MSFPGRGAAQPRMLLVVGVVALAIVAGAAGYLWPTGREPAAPIAPTPAAQEAVTDQPAEADNGTVAETGNDEEQAAPADDAPAEPPAALSSTDPRVVLEGFLTAYFGGDFRGAAQYLTGKAAESYEPDKDRAGTQYVGYEIKGDPVIINEAYVFRVTLRWAFEGMKPLESLERYTLAETDDGWRIGEMPGFP